MDDRQKLLKQLRWLRDFKDKEEKWYIYSRAVDIFLKRLEKYLTDQEN